tara:strand:+ start:1531 stop:1926 length:396 start_codon:yes stop_codon:yes gene_type:complete
MKVRTEAEKEKDYQMGMMAENKIMPKLSDHFGEEMYKDPWRNALIDFYNFDKTVYVELKRRRINFGIHYQDIMIGKNKIDYFRAINKQNDKTFYFVVSADNGDFIAEIDTECDYRRCEKIVFIPCGHFVKF